MNDDMLDTTIRTVVAAAVAGAPEPLEYPHDMGGRFIRVSQEQRGRRWAAPALLGWAAALVVALLVARVTAPSGPDASPGAPIDVPSTAVGTAPATDAPTSSAVDGGATWTTAPVWVTAVASPAWDTVGRGFVAAGPDGVWEFLGGGRVVQWSDQPVATALKAPDGTMIIQRLTGGAAASTTPEETVPQVLSAPMATPVPLLATLDRGYYVLHDVARLVDGTDVLVLEWFSPTPDDPQNGVYNRSRLLSVDLATGAVRTVNEGLSMFESFARRMHLTTTGIAVGEVGSSGQSGMMVVPLTGMGFTPQSLRPEDLGLDYAYDSGFGPMGYTIDTAGSTAAWVDAGSLVVKSVDDLGRPARTITLPWWNELFQVTDVEIDGTIALITGHQGSSVVVSTYIVTLATGESLPLGDGSSSVTMLP